MMNDANAGNAFPGNARLCPGIEEERERAGTEPGDPNAGTEPGDPNAGTELGGPSKQPGGPRGWYSRGYMPHFDSNDVVQHVTFHLADSLPADAVARMAAELELMDPEKRDVERRRRMEALIDAGHGSCLLREPRHAELVQTSMMSFDAVRYRLLAWVVMPNHVHVLFQTMNDWSMAKIVASWKAFTGRRISDVVRRDGARRAQVWHREYWDRFIRNERHFAAAVAYIHNNPVKAGLVANPEDWPWSSASAGNALPGNARLCPGENEKNAGTEPGGPTEKPGGLGRTP